MKKGFLFIAAVLSFSYVFGQALHRHDHTTDKGRFIVVQYDSNIYKIAYHPRGYVKNENISDAVIIRPGYQKKQHEVRFRKDSVFINKKLVLAGVHENGNTKGFLFPLDINEKIFGGGERALSLNRRGTRLNLYNNPWYGYGEGADNLNYSVPFITSSAGYGIFFDNPSRSYIDIGKSSQTVMEYGAGSGELNFFLILGNYRQVLESYHRLTGKQPLPPRWAFGNLMSRFGYTSEENVKSIYEKMRQFNVPVDAIIFDLFWFGDSIKGTMGNLDWVNRTKWPDPARMIREFKQEGVQTILVTEPFFVETSKNYKASLPFLAVDSIRKPYYLKDFYFGKGGLLDIFRNDAQQWFWKFYRAQMQMGVEAWWGDLGEPEKHPSDLYHNLRDLGQKRLFAADEVHNIYGHAWTKMLFNNYRKYYPEKRLFSLNRSGFAGSQRYSIFPWTGDVSRSWGGYRAQLPVLLGMTMSGVPYVHSDAGGFAGGEGDMELYVRWLQFAAFTPIFRPHGTALYEVAPESFSFPSEAALMEGQFRDAAIEVVHTRYHFLPYNYTLAYRQAKWGSPLMAPMYYHFSGDTVASAIQDQYMWGDQVMVAPVLEKAAATRKYYLPKGKWYHYLSGRILNGNGWITDSISLAEYPVLIKEGSFLPLQNRLISNTGKYSHDSILVLHLPSTLPASGEIFNDDGRSASSMKQGKFSLLSFSSAGVKNGQETIIVQAKNPAGQKRRKIFLFVPDEGKFLKAELNGKPINITASAMPVTGKGKGRLISFYQGRETNRLRVFYNHHDN